MAVRGIFQYLFATNYITIAFGLPLYFYKIRCFSPAPVFYITGAGYFIGKGKSGRAKAGDESVERRGRGPKSSAGSNGRNCCCVRRACQRLVERPLAQQGLAHPLIPVSPGYRGQAARANRRSVFWNRASCWERILKEERICSIPGRCRRFVLLRTRILAASRRESGTEFVRGIAGELSVASSIQ